MRPRLTLPAAVVLAVGALLGWSGLPRESRLLGVGRLSGASKCETLAVVFLDDAVGVLGGKTCLLA